jgi:hypothetical protein
LKKPVEFCDGEKVNHLEQNKVNISDWIKEYHGSERERLLSDGLKNFPGG